MSQARVDYKFEVVDQSRDGYNWELMAVCYQWKTTVRKRLFRKPVVYTGWQERGRTRVGTNYVNASSLAKFKADWIDQIAREKESP